jgi:hypothetical protein
MFVTVSELLGSNLEKNVCGDIKGKKVVIVGAGPAGLNTARKLALRGADVTLLEKQSRICGAIRDVEFTRSEIRRKGIKVQTATYCSALGYYHHCKIQEEVAAELADVEPDVNGYVYHDINKFCPVEYLHDSRAGIWYKEKALQADLTKKWILDLKEPSLNDTIPRFSFLSANLARAHGWAIRGFFTNLFTKYTLWKTCKAFLKEAHRVTGGFNTCLGLGISHMPSDPKILKELSMPFGDWLISRGLEDFLPFITFTLTSPCYGHVNQVSTFYALLFLLPIVTLPIEQNMSFRNSLRLPKYGIEKTFQAVHRSAQKISQQKCGCPLRTFLNTKIEKVIRKQSEVVVTWEDQTSGSVNTESFDYIFVASPPKHCGTFLDLNPNELQLFSDIKCRKVQQNVFTRLPVAPRGFDPFGATCQIEYLDNNTGIGAGVVTMVRDPLKSQGPELDDDPLGAKGIRRDQVNKIQRLSMRRILRI